MAFPGETVPIGAEVTRAARELAGSGVANPVVVGYHPVARMNPFQELLYSAGADSGVTAVPLIQRVDLPVLEAAVKMGVPAVLHLHWTNAIVSAGLDEADADRRGRQFINDLSEIKALGIHLVWTVHNVLPHHCQYPDAEARMRGQLAELADGIHIMNPHTAQEVAAHYDLPEHKVFNVPHPSYAGFYPDVNRGDARFALGFSPDQTIIGAVGSIQRYKGLSAFADAVERVSRTNPLVRGLIAGIPGPDSGDLIEELSRESSVSVVAKKLTDREVAQAMAAIDYMALPYERTLNSGAAALAATFDVPIIAPHVGAFLPMLDSGMGIGFNPDGTSDLGWAIGAAAKGEMVPDQQAADAYRSSIDPMHISRLFFDQIVKLVH